MFNWVAGPPDPPKILYDNSTISGRNASVKWTSPEHYYCNITMYSICYRETEPSVNGWKQLNVSGITSYELHLKYSKKYEVKIVAWNKLGPSESSKAWEPRTAQGTDIIALNMKSRSAFQIFAMVQIE